MGGLELRPVAVVIDSSNAVTERCELFGQAALGIEVVPKNGLLTALSVAEDRGTKVVVRWMELEQQLELEASRRYPGTRMEPRLRGVIASSVDMRSP